MEISLFSDFFGTNLHFSFFLSSEKSEKMLTCAKMDFGSWTSQFEGSPVALPQQIPESVYSAGIGASVSRL